MRKIAVANGAYRMSVFYKSAYYMRVSITRYEWWPVETDDDGWACRVTQKVQTHDGRPESVEYIKVFVDEGELIGFLFMEAGCVVRL